MEEQMASEVDEVASWSFNKQKMKIGKAHSKDTCPELVVDGWKEMVVKHIETWGNWNKGYLWRWRCATNANRMTNKALLYLENEVVPIRYIIKAKILNFLHYILSQK